MRVIDGVAPVLGWERPLVDRAHRLLEARSAPVGALLGAAVLAAGAQRRAVLWRQR
jgi:hypothetical protein